MSVDFLMNESLNLSRYLLHNLVEGNILVNDQILA